MGEKIILKKAGKKGWKEINTDEILDVVVKVTIYSHCFKLHKSKGRPKTILHEWIFQDICKNKKLDFDRIIYYTEGTRKEILGEFYGKEYIEDESWETLYQQIKLKKISTPYGD